MMKLKCKPCGYSWGYKGEHEFWATCPRCRSKVRIPKKEVGVK